jgi:hypothetical protein
MPKKRKTKRAKQHVSLPVEIDRLGITILEKLIEGLIEVLDRVERDSDLEDGGDAELDPETSPNACRWAGGCEGRDTIRHPKRPENRHIR